MQLKNIINYRCKFNTQNYMSGKNGAHSASLIANGSKGRITANSMPNAAGSQPCRNQLTAESQPANSQPNQTQLTAEPQPGRSRVTTSSPNHSQVTALGNRHKMLANAMKIVDIRTKSLRTKPLQIQ